MTDVSSVVVSGVVRAIGSSTTCSITEGMIGGKYPSPLIARLGDIVIGAVSLRLIGSPLIIPLVLVLNGGSTGRTDDPMTEVGDVSWSKRLFIPIDVDRRGFLGMVSGSKGSAPCIWYRRPGVSPIGLVSGVYSSALRPGPRVSTHLSSDRFLRAGDTSHDPFPALGFFLHPLIGFKEMMRSVDYTDQLEKHTIGRSLPLKAAQWRREGSRVGKKRA